MSGPAACPCGSCPYRRDVPSGVWAREEYEKLPAYDNDTANQPPTAFFCHQQNGRLCAGWVGCHDMENSLGLRMVAAFGAITPEAYEAALDYETDVPLFASGQEAYEHGITELRRPGDEAQRVMERVTRKQARLNSPATSPNL